MARVLAHKLLAAALMAALALPAAAQTPKPARGSTMAPPDPPSAETDRMKTSDQVKKGSVEGAVTTPLRDLNVMKVDIPPILLQALDDPYERPRNTRCATLIALVRPLNDVLGPDIDTLPEDDDGLGSRGKSTALGVAGDGGGGAVPGGGVARQPGGAESHARGGPAGFGGGHPRRPYRRGGGEARGGGPPATPSHVRTAHVQAAAKARAAGPQPPPSAKSGGLTPRYPTRAEPTAAPQTNAGKR